MRIMVNEFEPRVWLVYVRMEPLMQQQKSRVNVTAVAAADIDMMNLIWHFKPIYH